ANGKGRRLTGLQVDPGDCTAVRMECRREVGGLHAGTCNLPKLLDDSTAPLKYNHNIRDRYDLSRLRSVEQCEMCHIFFTLLYTHFPCCCCGEETAHSVKLSPHTNKHLQED
ncbi:unnamed protein product, partial [Discosporangium mesarthrocarpum]